MVRACFEVPDAFSGEECERIIALGAQAEAAPVWLESAYGLDSAARDVSTALRSRGPDTEWLFSRLDELFARAAEVFQLNVGPLRQQVQILRYDVGSHFARWHTDAGRDLHDDRKISLSVELSERFDYEGGELEIVPDTVGRLRTLPRGGASLFPSRALHRVTPVTRGTRWSLVAWTG
jgi:PKHD-type hydroxylase